MQQYPSLRPLYGYPWHNQADYFVQRLLFRIRGEQYSPNGGWEGDLCQIRSNRHPRQALGSACFPTLSQKAHLKQHKHHTIVVSNSERE